MQPGLFTTPGTIYAHHGDWRRAWWLWPEHCALVMDPPFGQRYKSSHTNEGWGGKREGVERTLATHVVGDETTCERDEAMDQPWSVAAVWGPRRLDRIPPWGSEAQLLAPLLARLRAAGNDAAADAIEADARRMYPERIPPREILCHDKKGVGMGDLSLPWKPSWETIAIYGDGWVGRRTDGVLRGAVVPFSSSSASNGRIHPNQKPLAVCAEIVGKLPKDGEIVVVDPFFGSGSIPIAAALLGFDVYCAEIDDAHYTDGVARMRGEGLTVAEGPA